MNNLLSRYLLFYPVRILTGQKFLYHNKEILNIHNKISNEVDAYLWGKVVETFKRAFNNIPYYNEIFKERMLNPNEIKSQNDLLRYPIMDKNIFSSNIEKLYNPKIKKYFYRSTSGSTGSPFIFYKDCNSMGAMDAAMFYGYSWHGISPGDASGRFWGLPISGKSRYVNILKDKLMNRVRLSAFELKEKEIQVFINKLNKLKPTYFYGYPSIIFEFVEFCKKKHLKINHNNLKCIIGTGELIVKNQITEIENFFNVPFVNEYGCTEVGPIGIQCPAGNMHLMNSNVFMEVIKDGSHVYDEEGEIYITELNSNSLPFIRYKLNDIGLIKRGRCQCGLNSPIIEITKGRVDSYIITSKGDKIYDAVLAYNLKKGIKAFKAVQTEINKIDVYVIPDQNLSEELIKTYNMLLKKQTDVDMNFCFHITESLPRDNSGKLRYFIPLKE